MLLATFTSILLIVVFVLLFFNRRRLFALFVMDILFSVLLFSDTLYFRYYYNAITVPVLYQIGYVGDVSDSIQSLLNVRDLIFIINIPVFITALLLFRKHPAFKVERIHPVKRIISVIIVFCLSFGLFQYAYGKSSHEVFEYDNNYVIDNLGIFYFHYYDVKRNIQERFFADHKLTRQEKSELDQFFGEKAAAAKATAGAQYAGIAKGKNVIVIQLEAIQQFIINATFNGKEITPNLNKYINDSVYLDNFYYQVGTGNTADAELLSNTSLYPLKDGAVYFKYPSNTYESLPSLLKKEGYSSYVFHANNPSFWNRTEIYKAIGFKRFFSQNDYEQDDHLGWGLSDKSFFRQNMEKLDTLSGPFYSFMITLSSHHPFTYFEGFKDFDAGRYEETMAGNYMKAANYVDQALGRFFEDLKSKGLYENSVIVLYGDHHAMLKEQTDSLKALVDGYEFTEYNWTMLHKTPCFIRFPGMKEKGVNHTVCGEIDVLPTIANLLGVKAPHALGKDILNTPEENGYAVLRDGSVITRDYAYVSADDTVYGADGQPLEKGAFSQEIEKYQKELDISDIILQKNALASYK
jgi:phosphoglycerol transferase MdoB-like AlkP superfamily enzyme